MATLPGLSSLADRAQTRLSCAVLGPTRPSTDPGRLAQQRQHVTELCQRYTRTSDVCAPVGDADVAVLAFDADLEGLSAMVQRLNRYVGATREEGDEAAHLSAGIVMLSRSQHGAAPEARGPGPETKPAVARISHLSSLASAQHALSEARSAGGGVLIAEQT